MSAKQAAKPTGSALPIATSPASAAGEFVPVGYRFRVLPEHLRPREWKVGAMPVEYKQPTPPDNDTIEFQTIYVLADQGGSDK